MELTSTLTRHEEERVLHLASSLEDHGGVRINIESYSTDRAAVARDRELLRAAAALLGVPVKIENVSGYFLRARVVQ